MGRPTVRVRQNLVRHVGQSGHRAAWPVCLYPVFDLFCLILIFSCFSVCAFVRIMHVGVLTREHLSVVLTERA